MAPKQCPNCGGTEFHSDPSMGQVSCALCFAIVEENQLVSEVGFSEGAGGRIHVQGTFVSHFSSGFKNGGSEASAERIKSLGHERIRTIADNMAIDDMIMNKAKRFFNLAIDAKFNKGRRTEYVVASCLYLASRYAGGDRMLIDFSERLTINVFELGSTYLKLRSALHLKDPMPEVDPAIYNIRFAHRLDFGSQSTRQVAADASRLVKRFQADWMTQGRRPAGIAGACLVVAARMSGFLRTPEEVAQVVKVAPSTIKRRLLEFARTQLATKTVAEWRSMPDDEVVKTYEAEPPISRENREKETAKVEAIKIERLRDQEEEGDEHDAGVERPKKRQKKGKGKKAVTGVEGRGEGEVEAEHNPDGAIQAAVGEIAEDEVDEEDEEEDDNLAEMEQLDFINEMNSARDNPEEVAKEVAASSKAFKRQARALNSDNANDDDQLSAFEGMSDLEVENEDEAVEEEEFDQWEDEEATFKWLGEKYFADEVQTFKLTDDELRARVKGWLGSREPIEIYNEIRCIDNARKERERYWKEERQAEFPDIDDEELESYYVMDEEDVLSRTRAWLSHNGRWLEEEQERIAKRAAYNKEHNIDPSQPKPKKKKRAAPHRGPFNSAREAIDTFANQKKFSNRLNYAVLNSLEQFPPDKDGDIYGGLEAFGDEKEDEKIDEDDPSNW